MENYYNFPRWNHVISEIPQNIRPSFRWLCKLDMEGWCGDVEAWIANGTIKAIYRVYLYDINTVFDHIDLAGIMRSPCPDRVQLIPVGQFIDYHNYESVPNSLVEKIEEAIALAWPDENKYIDISELAEFELCDRQSFQWDKCRHVQAADYVTNDPEFEEQTIGEVIEGLVEYYQGNPLWC